jgi:Replication-relaxation
MILTERDREILRQVHLLRLTTREQVERLLFPPENGQDHWTKTSKARMRLRLLYQHRYLERIPMPVGSGTWAWQPVYRLGRKGAELVASELGRTAQELPYWGKGDDKDHRTSKASQLFLSHTLSINDVRIAITEAAQAHGYKVEKWLDETHLKSQEMKDHVTVTSDQGRSSKMAVIPDAYFILHLGDRRAHFFLEVDRATITNRRWRMRILAYLELIRSGKYQARYQTRSLRILTVTTTDERLLNLKQTTERTGGKDLFWFTTLDQVTQANVLSSPIWLLANDERDSARKPLVS